MRTRVLASLFIIILAFVSLAHADLANQIEKLISSEKGVRFGIHVIDAQTGKTVFDHNKSQALVPASNMKIIVTAAALKYLGPEYEYVTKVGLCGPTLVIIGSGDPLLGDNSTDIKYGRDKKWILERMTEALRRNDIEELSDIIIDTTVFDNQRVHPSWPRNDLNRWYACELSGLNYNGNCIEITTKNQEGRIKVYWEPQTGFINLINQVRPIRKGSSAVGAYRNRVANKITLKGKCKDTVGPFLVAIEGPAAFFGYILAEHLGKEDIQVKGKLIERSLPDNCEFRPITEYRTSLIDCLHRCNKDSFGLAAEALLKTLGTKRINGGKGGSWESGQEAISQYLLGLGITQDQFHIDDGSGLSDNNKLSAVAITSVLHDVYQSQYWQVYKESFAVGGQDGTIDKYFQEQKYQGKIIGKTGYISGVKAFSGVCFTSKGKYIFSILTNRAKGSTRGAINSIAEAIIDDVESLN